MASGKSTIGRELAGVSGLPFIDLDGRVEDHAQSKISAIFAERGEAEFRSMEAQVLSDVIAELKEGPAVVATGGGTPVFGDNLARMRAAGLVVELNAPLDVLLARAGDGQSRPLLGDDEGVRALFAKRASSYRRAHVTVDVAIRTPRESAQKIAKLGEAATGLEGGGLAICAPGSATYPIAVSCGLLDRLDEVVAPLVPTVTKFAVVTDSNVGPIYGGRVAKSLGRLGVEVVSVEIAAGEATKTPAMHASVAEQLTSLGLDRNSVVVCLGGGVVGDLGGYVASSLYRGVSVIQVPTTLLAMTDSSVGGKTGVNLPSGKNLLGAFWQPTFVGADPDTLSTLPDRELRAGMGELYKYGLLDGEELYELINRYVLAPTDRELATEVITRCAGYKSWIVTRDEREGGERALLNLGHTVGHAIERAAGYGRVLHGEAVALGLIAAARISCALGYAAPELEKRIADSLAGAGLDANLDPWLTAEVLAGVGVDKKRTGAWIKFIVMRSVGVAEIAEIETNQIAKILLPTAKS